MQAISDASSRITVRLLHIIGLAVAYFVAGKLSLSLDNGTYFNTATIWLPSGIALACILIYGYRAYPGILLGSLLINTSTLVSENFSPVLLLIPLAISVSASLQAVSGAYLIKRYAGFPNTLGKKKDILLFLFYGGPVSALITSTLSVSAMAVAGQILAADFLDNWLIWWTGEVLGVIVFTPLTLTWMQHGSEIWKNRQLAIMLPLVAMFTLTLVAVYHETQYSNERINFVFAQQVDELIDALKKEINDYTYVLRSIKSHYEASESVSSEDFTIFTSSSFKNFPGIHALCWAPVIQASERESFEKKVQQNGYPNFQITEQDEFKIMVRAKDRAKYIPITFLEPYKNHETGLGFDFLSNQQRAAALTRATDTGEFTITTRVKLLQDANQYGIIAVMPSYRKALPAQTLEEKRIAIFGYAIGVFGLKDLVTTAFKNTNTAELSYQLLDTTAPISGQLLFSSDTPFNLPKEEKNWFSPKKTLSKSLSINIGDSVWRFDVVPTQNYYIQHRSVNAWLILVVGLLLTSLIAMTALLVSGRAHRLTKRINEHNIELERQHKITSRVQKDHKIALARLDLILDSTGEGIYGIDMEGKFIFANRAVVTMLGYVSQEEMLGKNSHQLHHHSHADGSNYDVSECPVFHALHGYSSEVVDSEVFWRKDNTSIQVQYQAHPIIDDDQIIGCVVNFTDVTLRKQDEEQIRKLSLAVEQIPAVIVITDLHSKIEYVNEQFVKTTGYLRDEVVGKNPSILQSGLTPKETYVDMWATLSKGNSWQGEFINQSKQGDKYLESVQVTPIRNSKAIITHYLAIKENITERKEYEAYILQAKEKAEAEAESKTLFLANMSHELRTPMNSIIGFSQLALLKKMPDEIKSYLQQINSSSTDLLKILNDILDLSKLKTGAVRINSALFNLENLSDTLFNLFTQSAQDKGLTFDITIATNVPRMLIGDKLRLQQVLINLLANALKFTLNGSVSLDITLLDSEEPSQARLLFNVQDSGIGISLGELTKLFLPFSQADESINRSYGGTGLGLALSNNLVRLMGGEFNVVSTPGLGSSFSFKLVLGVPTKSEQSKALISETTLNSELNSELNLFFQLLTDTRVLVVEDNSFNQDVIREFLNLANIHVEIANNGSEALEILDRTEFDLVLMDVHMPLMNGFEATRLIRSQARFTTLPVIAVTAGVTENEHELCLASGMNDFINKPIDLHRLLATLVRWIKPDAIVTDSTSVSSLSSVSSVCVEALSSATQIPGFDLKNIYKSLGNNQELTMQLLLNFKESVSTLAVEIAVLLAEGDINLAREHLHTLKGAASNMGAMPLHAAAEALEIELHQGLPTAKTINTFKVTFDQAMSAIEDHSQAISVSVGDCAALAQCAVELDLLLSADDYISEILLSTMHSHLATEQLDLFTELRKSLNKMNYDQARKVLRKLVTTLPD